MSSVELFPDRMAPNLDRDSVSIASKIDGREYLVLVTWEALTDGYGLRSGDWNSRLACARANISAIQDVVARKFRLGALEPDESIMVRSADVR